jgi:hypothetical protein
MKDILNSHPVAILKQEISKTNIKGYSKMKKAEVIKLMMKNKDKFSYIKMAEKKERKKPEKKPEKKIKLKPEKKPEKKIKLKPEKKPKKKELTEKEKRNIRDSLFFVSNLEKRIKENNVNAAYYNRPTIVRLVRYLKDKPKSLTDKYSDKQLNDFLKIVEPLQTKIIADRLSKEPAKKEVKEKKINIQKDPPPPKEAPKQKKELKLEDNVNWRITAQDAVRSINSKKQIIKHLDKSQQKDIFGKYQAMLDDAKKTNNIEKFKKIYFDLNVMKRSKKIQLPLTPNEEYKKQQEEKRKIEKEKRAMIPEDKEVKPLLNKLNDKINMMQEKYHKYNMIKSNRKEYQTVLKKHYEDSMKVFKELRSYKMSPEQIKKYKVVWRKLTTHMNSIFK